MQIKRIIVTGGTYGIGSAIVAALAAERFHVVMMGRSVDLGEQLAERINAEGRGSVSFHHCDVSNRSQVKAAFAWAVKHMGGLDGLVHVAGVEGGGAPEEVTDEEWEHIFSINAKGTFITNQEAFPYLREKGGRILNFGSGAGTIGLAGSPAYAASKGAVASWTRSIALAWGQYGITANIILPNVWTPMYDHYRARMSPEELAAHDVEMRQRIPIGGKMGDPSTDVAPVILFLLGDGARFITGQPLHLDGGITMAR